MVASPKSPAIPDDGAPRPVRRSDGERRLLLKDIARVLLVVLFFATMLVLLRSETVRHNVLEVSTLRAAIQAEEDRFGALSSRILFLVAASVLVGVGVPRLYASALAGAIYGAGEGIALGLSASLIGSGIAYRIGRSLLAGTVRRRIAGKLAAFQEKCRNEPFWWVLYARLMPFANSTLLSLACGASRVPVRPFLLASAIGFLPLTIVFALFGSGGAKGDWTQIGVGTLCLLLSIPARKLFRRMRRDLS